MRCFRANDGSQEPTIVDRPSTSVVRRRPSPIRPCPGWSCPTPTTAHTEHEHARYVLQGLDWFKDYDNYVKKTHICSSTKES